MLSGNIEQGPQRRAISGLLPAFLRRMRHFLAIAIAFQCARLATAGTLPLTGNDIVLMLRMGYSSEDIMRDLNAKHFAGPLDSSSEAQIRQLNASPKLLDDLKSGQFDATADQVTQAQQKIAAVNAAAEEFTAQKRTALQAGEAVKSIPIEGIAAQHRTGIANRGQERTRVADSPQIIDLEFGQPLDLRQFNGPNMQLIVTGLDLSDVLVTLLDYDRMQFGGSGDFWSGYHASSGPTRTRIRVKKENDALIYSWGRTKLVYIDAMDKGLNHVKVGIVSQ